MDPVKILKRAWYILWSYQELWIFGLIIALATAGSTGRGSNNGVRYEQGRGDPAFPQGIHEAFREAGQELQKLFREGIPGANLAGATFSTLLWVIGSFVVLMLLVGIIVAIACYVSETAVIRMVDEYESSGNK